ncbi:estrogen sulfotransferase-like isoform X2 [Limulus polyphemus]|uniref:Estrogen sulfotransferase-like isoform X2 n=1 Tax=Limulus polyphemus TaxID=6850 RepID=A0ABM1TJF0_LIMPO|nr:estrogen sulfotransferase-like isoform X2 [Limulus polyphemus]
MLFFSQRFLTFWKNNKMRIFHCLLRRPCLNNLQVHPYQKYSFICSHLPTRQFSQAHEMFILLNTRTFYSQTLRNAPEKFLQTMSNPLHSCVHFMSGSGSEHVDLKRWKLIKRLFSTFLFGSTLIITIFVKRKRQKNIRELLQDCDVLPHDSNYSENMVFTSYKGYIIPQNLFLKGIMRDLMGFKVREDDIFVVSFPKTGTTWVQELVYVIATDLDFNAAQAKNLEQRFPFIEFFYPGLKIIEKTSSPRFLKSHLPYTLLPPEAQQIKPKIVYIMRNPKDVLVSYYHFLRMVKEISYKGSFEEFFKSFLDGKIPYGPIWKHYLEWWEHRNDENVLFLFYEDLHKDIVASVKKIADFLGKSLTEEEIERIAYHCSFQQMAKNPSVNYSHWDDLDVRNKNEAEFMRKGIVGDWKNYFTKEMNQVMDEWIEEKFQSEETGLFFCYDL